MTTTSTAQEFGNAQTAFTDLLADSQTKPATAKTDNKSVAVDDPRFAGKSNEQIIEMYRNLESHSGRLASDLGSTKQQLDAYSKRENDLRQNGGDTKPLKVDGVELLSNPTETLERFVTDRTRESTAELQNRLNSLESQLGAQTFANRHPDASTLIPSEEFQRFSQATPLRQQLRQNATNGNYQAAGALLDEFKAFKASISAADPLADAKAVTLEGTRSGSDGGTAVTGKTYKRADIMALRTKDPDTYERPDIQAALLKAYREGRVID